MSNKVNWITLLETLEAKELDQQLSTLRVLEIYCKVIMDFGKIKKYFWLELKITYWWECELQYCPILYSTSVLHGESNKYEQHCDYDLKLFCI